MRVHPSRLSQAQFRLSKSSEEQEHVTRCNRTAAGQEWLNDYVRSLKKLDLKYWTLPCQERFKFGAGDPVVCKTAYFIPVLIHGACAVTRVSVVPGNLGYALFWPILFWPILFWPILFWPIIFWPIPLLANSSFGQFLFWPIPLLANFSFGQFLFRPISLSANSSFGQFLFWPIPLLANSSFDQFLFWPIPLLANSSFVHFFFFFLFFFHFLLIFLCHLLCCSKP